LKNAEEQQRMPVSNIRKRVDHLGRRDSAGSRPSQGYDVAVEEPDSRRGCVICPKALVIDDNAVIRESLKVRLESRGWEVAEACSPAEGLRRYWDFEPALVTLDLLMPHSDLDAVHFARHVKEETPDVTVLVVSAFSDEPGTLETLRRHGLEVFSKPGLGSDSYERLFARIDQIFSDLVSYS
jgi:CheY-like chemotaxis protein